MSITVRRGLAHTAAAAAGAVCLLAVAPTAASAAEPPPPTCSGQATTYAAGGGTLAVCPVEITEKNGHKEKGTQISYSVTKRRGVGNIAVTVYDCHTSNGDDLKACPSTLDATYTMVWTNVVKGSPASVNLVLDHGGTAPMYWTDRTTTKPLPLQYVGQV